MATGYLRFKKIMSNLKATLGVATVSWRYVLTEGNPADDITRGLSPMELGMGFCYSGGPKFLYESAELWPGNKVKVPYENNDIKEKKDRLA